jgi:hypothetical protein
MANIDKLLVEEDHAEKIRDAIAQILKTEIENQKDMA